MCGSCWIQDAFSAPRETARGRTAGTRSSQEDPEVRVACALAPSQRASRHTAGGGRGNRREPPRAHTPVEVWPCVLSKCGAVSVVTWEHWNQRTGVCVEQMAQNIWERQSHGPLIRDDLSA